MCSWYPKDGMPKAHRSVVFKVDEGWIGVEEVKITVEVGKAICILLSSF